jgi:hypothetical protein
LGERHEARRGAAIGTNLGPHHNHWYLNGGIAAPTERPGHATRANPAKAGDAKLRG